MIKQQGLEIFAFKLSNFHTFEVVGRGNQKQMGKILN